MQEGSIVKLKRGVVFPIDHLVKLAMLCGVISAPAPEQEYVVTAMSAEFCPNCNKEHTYLQLDGVKSFEPCWDAEDFDELQPPQSITVEGILKNPGDKGEGIESEEEMKEELQVA